MNVYPQIHHFMQGNPAGSTQGDVPAMLRRVAESIEELGVVTVQHIAFENEVDENGLWPKMTVYFHYGSFDDDGCTCGRCKRGIP